MLPLPVPTPYVILACRIGNSRVIVETIELVEEGWVQRMELLLGENKTDYLEEGKDTNEGR